MKELLFMSGREIARRIQNMEITSVEVTQVHIEAVKKVNPLLNAVVADRFEEALREAERADEQVRSGDMESLPPYHGVPCTVKESIGVKGLPQTGGVYYRKKYVLENDPPVVSRLRSAGVIVMGVTNVPELCMWMETSNTFYGRTRNPYNPDRIVGGSSGGEGAIIGAGASPFGLGSDIGGSIRMPSFFNGIFGHKPSGGLVPNTGQFPNAENEALFYLNIGPMARRAEDLMPLLRLIAGPDGQDPVCREIPLGDPETVNISTLRVISVPDNGRTPVSRDLREAQKKATQYLSTRGASVKEMRIEELKSSLAIWSSMLTAAEGTPFGVLMGNGKRINALLELLKWALRVSEHTFPAIMLSIFERFTELNRKKMERFVEEGRNLRKQLEELMGENGVILYPPYSRPAPRHHMPLLTPFHWVYTAIVNVMGFPATQVPLGLNRDGLPVGVQVIAAHGNDHLAIAVAMELEKGFGGWVPPPIFREKILQE